MRSGHGFCAVSLTLTYFHPQSLRQEIEDKFKNDKFRWEDVRPNDAAGLLKQFLRDLPIPLLTYEYLEAFAQVEST